MNKWDKWWLSLKKSQKVSFFGLCFVAGLVWEITLKILFVLVIISLFIKVVNNTWPWE